MSTLYQAVRGMNDLLPESTPRWQQLEQVCRDVLQRYAYQEIRFPIVESTQVFTRSVGEATDIVEKEMYTFDDRNGDSLSLRPEGTACCVRACIQHGLLHNAVQRLWYLGPMFRHERPQKGRYRQFYQLGVETYGMSDPAIDAELIILSAKLWRELGLQEQLRLEINTLASHDTRAQYRHVLVDYFEKNAEQLDEDSQRRLHKNPLRILDSKNPAMTSLIASAPALIDYLDDESRLQFDTVCKHLDAAGITYTVNPRLVRGIDYYCHTVFEWVTDALGAQGTVCAGGRYDGLVESMGGKPTPATGFAVGMERLILLLEAQGACVQQPDVYVIVEDDANGLLVAEQLRDAHPHLSVMMNAHEGGLKAQFKRADKSGARYVVIVNNEALAIKALETGEQTTLTIDELKNRDFS